MEERYPVIRFHQFASGTPDDELIIFAAPAGEIAAWAGIPRKGWRLRMLYQRWITPGRELEVKAFWDDAGHRDDEKPHYRLGPTALTLAATLPVDINSDGIALAYNTPYSSADTEYEQLKVAAGIALTAMKQRLLPDEINQMDELASDLEYSPSEYEPNHVLQSAIQIAQLHHDAEAFCSRHEILPEERSELLEALESLCRPALVVDGQHRLLGAAKSDNTVFLPVVLIPNAHWIDQIYQFVVVNETAQRVKTDLLTDIFGNSLTPAEQTTVRKWLAKSNIDIEPRIAAVTAGAHQDSPFQNLIKLQLKSGESQGFITEATIRDLIDGGRGGSPGWRSDPNFYENYIRPTVDDVEVWQSWTEGLWSKYWFAFWDEVGKFYNKESGEVLWGPSQTNLTKGITLRLLQELFMTVSVEDVKAAVKASDTLRSALETRSGLPAEEVEEIVNQDLRKAAIPDNVADFRQHVRENFLADGVPVRVFTRKWVSSLDQQAGIESLRAELRKAYDQCKRKERYRVGNREVFAVEDSE